MDGRMVDIIQATTSSWWYEWWSLKRNGYNRHAESINTCKVCNLHTTGVSLILNQIPTWKEANNSHRPLTGWNDAFATLLNCWGEGICSNCGESTKAERIYHLLNIAWSSTNTEMGTLYVKILWLGHLGLMVWRRIKTFSLFFIIYKCYKLLHCIS